MKPKSQAKARARFDKRVDAFLSQRRTGEGGGWARFTEGDMATLNLLIEELIDLKSDRDCDGDQSIRWDLEEKYKYEPGHWFNIPHIHDDYSNLENALGIALINLGNATDKANRVMRHREAAKREREKKP